MKKFLLTAGLCLAASLSNAASIDLFQSGTSTTDFGMGSVETRETIIDVNSAVTLTELGAEIDPNGDISFRWNIWTSNLSAAEISNVFTTDFSVTDVGMAVYDTSVNVSLAVGRYIIQLENLGISGSRMARYNEFNQDLPFDVDGGAITVLNGSANNSANNTILPAISISTGPVTPPIPLPASSLLLGAGIFAFGAMRRFRKS